MKWSKQFREKITREGIDKLGKESLLAEINNACKAGKINNMTRWRLKRLING